MAKKKKAASRSTRTRVAIPKTAAAAAAVTVSTNPDDMLLAALAAGSSSLETGRQLVTFHEGMMPDALGLLNQHFMVADARDFERQAVTASGLAGADSVVFPEIGVALVASAAMTRSIGVEAFEAEASVATVEPEHFVFALQSEFMRGFVAATNAITRESRETSLKAIHEDIGPEVSGATWGLSACNVPQSRFNGKGIRIAILDTGMDIGHPDFAGRVVTSQSFVSGEPVQDLHGHGTHCIGTSAGPQGPQGTTPRYGIAWGASIFAGKVLSNSGSGTDSSILAGINWALANRCEIISMSLGSNITTPKQAYTNAGQAALNKGSLIIAAAGNNSGQPTGSPANSPTIFAVSSLDQNLQVSYFSSLGKVEIAAPGRDVFSAAPRPKLYQTMSGTSMATPHVAGCAALWAQSSPSLRGAALWKRLQSSAKKLPLPVAQAGAGLVQAP